MARFGADIPGVLDAIEAVVLASTVCLLWVLVVQKRAGGSIDAVGRPGRFCNSRPTDVGGSYALIASGSSAGERKAHRRGLQGPLVARLIVAPRWRGIVERYTAPAVPSQSDALSSNGH